ncbi:hypothetical protein HQQ81_05645 [Microbacteriaceae bacterium VKM Ac-2854]|nr:hypothetical protein [Microbacteriaceae bacterium VKM Ac-2854]
MPDTAPRLTAALELRDLIAAALADADLAKVTATIDLGDAASAAREGCVVVSLPNLDWTESFYDVAIEWEVNVIAGPADNYVAAWTRIDAIIHALELSRLPLLKGKPAQYQPLSGQKLPGFTLTLTTDQTF